jgi:uncharacterized protein (TIGR02145 family)
MDLDPTHNVFRGRLNEINNAVKFNPMPTSSDFYDYSGIPFNSSGADIADTNYANVQAGKGDPCKLIGLTVAELRAMTSEDDLTALLEGRPDDYKGWRLPTMEENCIFTDGTTSTATESYGTNVTQSGSGTAADPDLVTFLKGGNAILPAAGNRGTSGAVADQGTDGDYWSATSYSTGVYDLYFDSAYVYPANIYNNRSYGSAVRCVRDTP